AFFLEVRPGDADDLAFGMGRSRKRERHGDARQHGGCKSLHDVPPCAPLERLMTLALQQMRSSFFRASKKRMTQQKPCVNIFLRWWRSRKKTAKPTALQGGMLI